MPQIKSRLYFALVALSLSLSGCGDKNSKSDFSSDSGHPAGWSTSHKDAAIDSCKECHGENLDGGIAKVSCTQCHGNPSAGCAACHGGRPYGPYGTTAPNRKFAHTKHALLVDCDICHQNAGPGTPNHGKLARATVALSNSYRAKTLATYAYDPATGRCSGISCHGGQASPSFMTGTLSIATDCLLCHERGTAYQTPQYNSYYSGNSPTRGNLHDYHIGKGFSCTDCHNIGTLTDYTKHFSGLAGNTFTAPGATIGGPPTKIGANGYDTTLRKCSNVTCHSFNASWMQ